MRDFEHPYVLDPFVQSFLNNEHTFYLLEGGRAGGKSWTVTDFLLMQGLCKNMRIVSGRETLRSIEDSNYALFSDRIDKLDAKYEKQKTKFIAMITGSEIKFRGFREYGIYNTKGLEGVDVLFIDEAQQLTQKAIDVIIPTIIRKENAKIIFCMNRDRKEDPVYKTFLEHPKCLHIKCNYYDNPFISDGIRDEAKHDEKTNPPKYKHVWLGEPLDGNEWALWKYEFIKYKSPLEFKRTIIAIDPAVSTEEQSDETGIVVCGHGGDGKYYVIEDLSGKYLPLEWGRVVNNAYERHRADLVVAEKNQGGDLVKSNLQTVNQNLPVKLVHATKGKFIRAEPIASLYEQGKVFHIKQLPFLENQMTEFKIDIDRKKAGSPDRVDALVWGLTELALQNVNLRVGIL